MSKTRNCSLKTRNCVLQMMNFVFKMMDFAVPNFRLRHLDDVISMITVSDFAFKMMGFAFKMMGFVFKMMDCGRAMGIWRASTRNRSQGWRRRNARG